MLGKTQKHVSESFLRGKYKQLDQREHVLKRPDSYMGSIEPDEINNMWLCTENDEFVRKNVTISAGFIKIFDEILTNGSDQCQKTRLEFKMDRNVQITKTIKVFVNKEDNTISVYNDGEGIPVVKNEKGIWIPEMIFGSMLTSSNYDDEKEERTWGGRNGVGAKITNIYSEEFKLETIDHRLNKKFVQVWKNNMSNPEKAPKITSVKGKAYTKVTFKPDYKRFKMDGLNDDIIGILRRRTYDIAGCSSRGVSVYFNNKKLNVKDFTQYVSKYIGKSKKLYEKCNDNWEIVISVSPKMNFEHVSFVNGIYTMYGGKHVDHIANKISTELAKKINGKNKNGVKKDHVKRNLWVFINSFISNPSFSSQSKEVLTTPVKKFGSVFEISDELISKLMKTEIVKRAKSIKNLFDKENLIKTDGKKSKNIYDIPKLEDANWAGGKKSAKCTLILTEGDSAKTTAMAVYNVKGRDAWGIFPLRGKVMNTRKNSLTKIGKNAEIQNIKKILGLKENTQNISELRYGSVLIFTDMDHDGNHIKGLIMNLFENGWSHLLEPGFLKSMYTPLLKIRLNKKIIGTFYDQKSFEDWKVNQPLFSNKCKIKYYKGLGTSEKKEAQEYFKNMKLVNYTYDEESKESLDMAFSSDKVPKRKIWLSNCKEEEIIDYNEREMPICDFINKSYIHCANFDNVRSIPSMMDGLKPSQRKVIFTCFKRNQTKEIKVSQFTGYVTAETSYHHGESSMIETIIRMAQDFVGSNNLNLLYPSGQFGSRISGGKDHAQARYISTYMRDICKFIFRKEDEPLLNYIEDEGLMIEPKWYLPVIPMILVNGVSGIGTAHSTHVPKHNPKSIIKKIKRLLCGKNISDLTPWNKNFKGERVLHVWNDNTKKYYTRGKFLFSGNKFLVKELPVGYWTDKFDENIRKLIISNSQNGNKNKNQCIKSFKKLTGCDDENINYEIIFTPEKTSEFQDNIEKVVKLLNLEESITGRTTNLVLFDPLGEIIKFKNTKGILIAFFKIRLPFYQKRKEYQIKFLKREIKYLNAKVKFIKGIIDDEIKIQKVTDDEILSELKIKHKFPSDPMKELIIIKPMNPLIYQKAIDNEVKRFKNMKESEILDEEHEKFESKSDIKTKDFLNDDVTVSSCGTNKSDSINSNLNLLDEIDDDNESINCVISEEKRPVEKILNEDYGYLLSMQIRTLTEKKFIELQKLSEKKKKELDYIAKITPKQLWLKDLDELESKL